MGKGALTLGYARAFSFCSLCVRRTLNSSIATDKLQARCTPIFSALTSQGLPESWLPCPSLWSREFIVLFPFIEIDGQQ